MSYCRWSSDDYQCDVYVYEDVSGGWTTHTAGRRFHFTTPLPEPVDFREDFKAWYLRDRQVGGMQGDPKHGHWIDLPDVGDDRFNDDTPGECADRLESLREAGFNVPQYAIDALREEAQESAS